MVAIVTVKFRPLIFKTQYFVLTTGAPLIRHIIINKQFFVILNNCNVSKKAILPSTKKMLNELSGHRSAMTLPFTTVFQIKSVLNKIQLGHRNLNK